MENHGLENVFKQKMVKYFSNKKEHKVYIKDECVYLDFLNFSLSTDVISNGFNSTKVSSCDSSTSNAQKINVEDLDYLFTQAIEIIDTLVKDYKMQIHEDVQSRIKSYEASNKVKTKTMPHNNETAGTSKSQKSTCSRDSSQNTQTKLKLQNKSLDINLKEPQKSNNTSIGHPTSDSSMFNTKGNFIFNFTDQIKRYKLDDCNIEDTSTSLNNISSFDSKNHKIDDPIIENKASVSIPIHKEASLVFTEKTPQLSNSSNLSKNIIQKPIIEKENCMFNSDILLNRSDEIPTKGKFQCFSETETMKQTNTDKIIEKKDQELADQSIMLQRSPEKDTNKDLLTNNTKSFIQESNEIEHHIFGPTIEYLSGLQSDVSQDELSIDLLFNLVCKDDLNARKYKNAEYDQDEPDKFVEGKNNITGSSTYLADNYQQQDSKLDHIIQQYSKGMVHSPSSSNKSYIDYPPKKQPKMLDHQTVQLAGLNPVISEENFLSSVRNKTFKTPYITPSESVSEVHEFSFSIPENRISGDIYHEFSEDFNDLLFHTTKIVDYLGSKPRANDKTFIGTENFTSNKRNTIPSSLIESCNDAQSYVEELDGGLLKTNLNDSIHNSGKTVQPGGIRKILYNTNSYESSSEVRFSYLANDNRSSNKTQSKMAEYNPLFLESNSSPSDDNLYSIKPQNKYLKELQSSKISKKDSQIDFGSVDISNHQVESIFNNPEYTKYLKPENISIINNSPLHTKLANLSRKYHNNELDNNELDSKNEFDNNISCYKYPPMNIHGKFIKDLNSLEYQCFSHMKDKTIVNDTDFKKIHGFEVMKESQNHLSIYGRDRQHCSVKSIKVDLEFKNQSSGDIKNRNLYDLADDTLFYNNNPLINDDMLSNATKDLVGKTDEISCASSNFLPVNQIPPSQLPFKDLSSATPFLNPNNLNRNQFSLKDLYANGTPFPGHSKSNNYRGLIENNISIRNQNQQAPPINRSSTLTTISYTNSSFGSKLFNKDDMEEPDFLNNLVIDAVPYNLRKPVPTGFKSGLHINSHLIKNEDAHKNTFKHRNTRNPLDDSNKAKSDQSFSHLTHVPNLSTSTYQGNNDYSKDLPLAVTSNDSLYLLDRSPTPSIIAPEGENVEPIGCSKVINKVQDTVWEKGLFSSDKINSVNSKLDKFNFTQTLKCPETKMNQPPFKHSRADKNSKTGIHYTENGIPDSSFFKSTILQNRNHDYGNINTVKAVFTHYKLEPPEYEIVRENDVFKCTAVFNDINFVSNFHYEKMNSKNDACGKVIKYLSENWPRIFQK